ncbi:MAG: radical SAM/SPASM domain-containing protein [Sandaracinaceae bacterium]
MYDVEQLLGDPLLFEPLRRSVEEGALPAYLRSAKIKVTARCNLKCRMCRYGRGETPPEMSTADMLRVLDELAEMGCRKVHFSGGEVLVRKDFEALVERAATRSLKVTLTSNLTLLTKARAKTLMRHRVRSISTSLDGARAKTHDRIRGIEGSYRRTLRALGYLARERERRGRKTRLRVNFTLMRDNFREYPALLELAARHGVSDVLPMPVDTEDETLRLSQRLIHEYERDVAPAVQATRRRLGMPLGERYVHPFGSGQGAVKRAAGGAYADGFYRTKQCFAPWTHMFIAWNGQVFLCCMTNGRIRPLGDLRRQSVGEVFRGDAFQQIRREMRRERLPSCHQCDMMLDENTRLNPAFAPPAPAAPGRGLPVVRG